jgi:hypothetical protein
VKRDRETAPPPGPPPAPTPGVGAIAKPAAYIFELKTRPKLRRGGRFDIVAAAERVRQVVIGEQQAATYERLLEGRRG